MEQTGYGIPFVTKRYGETVFEFLNFFLRVTIPFEFELETDVPQDDSLYAWIEEQIRKNPSISTEDLASIHETVTQAHAPAMLVFMRFMGFPKPR